MKNRNTPTPLGTLGFLSRDTFNRVVPYLNHASRGALGATSPGFYRLINSCELAYLSDMPVNEQIAALCKLAIHLSELDTCYTTLPHTQIGNRQEDNQAIQGLVVARLRRSMEGVFANDLVAALTLACLARLDPKSYEEHQAHRVLAFSSIKPVIAISLRKLIYPPHHPLLVLMPREFTLPNSYEVGGLPLASIRALCRAIDKPKVAHKLATQQQSIESEFNYTSQHAYQLLKTNPPKAMMVSLLLKLNEKDLDNIWPWFGNFIQTNNVRETILSALPKLLTKWEESLPPKFVTFLNIEATLVKVRNRAELVAWYTDVFSILLTSENALIQRHASAILTRLIDSAISLGTLTHSEIVSLMTLFHAKQLEVSFRNLLTYENVLPEKFAHIVEVFVAQMEPATAAKELEWAIEHRALHSLTPLIKYATNINSRALIDKIFTRLESETIMRNRNGDPVPLRVFWNFVALLPTTDPKLEIIKPLIATILQKKQSSSEWVDRLPELSKILLRVIGDAYTHYSANDFIKILTGGLSNEQADDLFRDAQKDYIPDDEIWSGLSDHEKSQWLDRYATLHLTIAHKLPVLSLLNSKLLTKTLQCRKKLEDSGAINSLVTHIVQSGVPRLELLSFIEWLMLTTKNMVLAESILEQLPDFSVKLNDEERASLVNMLCQFLEYSLIARFDLVEKALNTLNKIANRLTSQQALKIFKLIEMVIIRDVPQHILPIISILVAIKDKIPFNKQSTFNYTMTRVMNVLRAWLNPSPEHATAIQHRVRNAALQALGQYVDYLNQDDIEHMLASFHTAVTVARQQSSDASFIIPIMHLLSSQQLSAVIADIHSLSLLQDKYTSAAWAKKLNKIITHLKDIGREDLVLILCEPSTLAAACSTQFTGLLMEQIVRRPLLQDNLLNQEWARFEFLHERVCTPSFEPANTPLELAANIVTYIKSINHTRGTARFDDEHRNRITTVKSLLALQTIAACLNSYQGTPSAKIILFHLVLLQLSMEASDRDLEFLFPNWDFSVYRRYHDLETRVIAYCNNYGHKKYAVDELRLQIDKLSDMDDPLIPHSIIQCLLQLDMSAKDSDEKAVNAIRDYCRQVENVERLNELTCLLVAARQNELAPLLQRKHSLSIHRHVLTPLELYDFGINQEEPCSGTAVKIFKIIHDARIVLLKKLPQAVVAAEEVVVDDDDFVVVMPRKQ